MIRASRVDGLFTHLRVRALAVGPIDATLTRHADGLGMTFSFFVKDWNVLRIEWGRKGIA
jgi:hypothetical protein